MMQTLLYRLLLVALTAGPLQAIAGDEPFHLQGLHTNLKFTDALARAAELGGTCESIRPRRKVGGLNTRCTFPACNIDKDTEACTAEELEAATFKIGGQPVHTLEIEAPAEDKRLRNISMFYAGDVEAALNRFLELYGEPKFDTAPQLEKSWTKSRRLMWQNGIQRISFMTRPQMIMLAADRPQYNNNKKKKK